MFSKFVIFAILILIPAWIVYKFNNTKPPELPEVNLEEWWGPGERKPDDTSVRSFRIEWSKEMISDLRRRLTNRRPLTPPLKGIAHQYGFNTATLQPILDFWRDGYDFEKRLEYLNKFPQYKTKIQGLDIHFLWVKPKVPPSVPPVPLLLLHGWPGSVREFYEAVPPLTSSRAGYGFSFELVVPSLPGFGYSEAAARPGLGPVDMAVVMRNLMRRLGHRQFVVQGGDWGSVVTSAMATLFPDEILGYHTNMPTNSDSTYYMKLILGSLLPWYLEPGFADRVYPLTQNFADRLEETGYFHLQATKPDTIGVAISDSPVGLAAYLLEKFSSATNMANRNKQDGGLSQYRMEDLVDILMMYWHPNCATTSFRLYAESFTKRSAAYRINEIPTDVPTWALHTANEPLFSPASLLTHKYRNLINISLIDVGGHFAAFEVEKEFTEDVFRAVKEFRLYERNENRKG